MFKRWICLCLALCLLMAGVPAANLLVTADTAGPVELTLGKAKLKVEVYADDVIRVRYTPDGTFRDKSNATFVDPAADWAPVDYTVEETDAAYILHTAKLDVSVDKTTGLVSYFDKAGNRVAAEGSRSATNVNLNGQTYYTVTQRFAAAETEYLYGFGNVENAVGLRGTAVTVQQSNTQKRTPMFYSNQGYGILFDVTSNGQLGWTSGNKEYYYAGRATDSMDYYFFYGPEADEVIAGYRQVTGTATMLPKNSFGYVQSRNRYPNQKALLDNVKMFRDKGIPLDVTVVDYYWWQGDFNNITQWNRNDWPDAAAMMKELHDMHVTASISVWPSFKAGTPTYNVVSKVEDFLLPTNSNFGYNYDPSTAANRSYYWDLINQNVFSKGFDSIWLDACEPETSNWVSNSTGELTAGGLNSRVIGLSYPLLTNQAAYEGQRAIEDNDKRVNTLTRGAVAGIQRYGTQSWSGDVASTWAQLEKEIRGALNYSAAGLPYFSTDTGGYFGIDTGNEANREMFLRWLQFSTFSGIMRVHGEGCIKEPWSFGAEYEEYIVSMINLRERMVPYIYSLAGAVTQEHGSMLRPLVFDYRTDPNVWTIDDQYMFGPSYMVCPVDTLGTRVRDIYLPAGRWINFWTGETIDSEGEHFTVTAALDEMPVFVKAGSVIPMAMNCQYVDEIVDEHEIRVYMGADGTFTLYEDEGNNYNYENGAFSTIELSYDEATRTLTIGDRKGAYEGMPETRNFHIVFVQEEYGAGVNTSKEYQTTVTYTGKKTAVTFDPDWETPIPELKLSTLPKPGAAPKPQSADKALVGEWPFAEGEGGKVKDTSGYFNNGAVINPTVGHWTEGVDGNALYFSGGSTAVPGNFVEVANSPSLNLTHSISFASWVYFPGGGHANILNKGGNGTKNPGYSFIIVDGNTLQLELQTQDGTKTSARATGTFPRNSWHHVAFTWQSVASGGDGIVRIYMDGQKVSDDQNGGNKFVGPIGTNESPLRLGRSDETEPNYYNYFKGTLDEAKLYNYALTAAEVKTLSEKKPITIPNPGDVTVSVADKALTLNWIDPAEATLDHILVTVTPEGDTVGKTYKVEKGVQTLALADLVNGKYYHLSLQTVLADGRTSQGSYLVSGVNGQAGQFTCLVTHDQTVYGYVTNYSNTPLTGTLIARVQKDGDTVSSSKLENFTVPALDSQRFQLPIGAYAEGQAVYLTFMEGATPLAQPATVTREERYVYNGDAAVLREVLRELIAQTIDESLYTAQSVTAYHEAKAAAEAALSDTFATVEQLNDHIRALRSTLVLKPPYILGDVDGDDAITSTDARLTLQYYAGKIGVDDLLLDVADVDGDGEITSTDARLILQKYAGKIEDFPAE